MKKLTLRYHHLGIPTRRRRKGEVHLKKHKVFHSGYGTSEFGIEWMRYEKGCTLPKIVQTLPHVAFEVDDVRRAIRGQNVIIQPNSPSRGVVVAFIEENGAPVELIQTRKRNRLNKP